MSPRTTSSSPLCRRVQRWLLLPQHAETGTQLLASLDARLPLQGAGHEELRYEHLAFSPLPANNGAAQDRGNALRG